VQPNTTIVHTGHVTCAIIYAGVSSTLRRPKFRFTGFSTIQSTFSEINNALLAFFRSTIAFPTNGVSILVQNVCTYKYLRYSRAIHAFIICLRTIVLCLYYGTQSTVTVDGQMVHCTTAYCNSGPAPFYSQSFHDYCPAPSHYLQDCNGHSSDRGLAIKVLHIT
jgi:hypothetical protein